MAELILKTIAVAVTDEVTILIDWVDIETLSGFTLVIENAGGGSADDITDVLIDTSDDGGVTSSLDQHAGVPAVPIATGGSATGTFTETAKFVRVRAVCAADEDTTAKAILLADSSTGRICTVADIKSRLSISATDNDSLIAAIIAGVGEISDNYTGRSLIAPAADVTEYHTGNSSYLQLLQYPIISITSVKEASDYDFDNADALEADDDYRILAGGKKGIIYKISYCNWLEFPDSVRVVYRGGYCSAGQTPAAGETALPSDLREAAIEQVTFIYKRKDDIGLSAVSFPGTSINKFAELDLLPLVKQTLDKYKRVTL